MFAFAPSCPLGRQYPLPLNIVTFKSPRLTYTKRAHVARAPSWRASGIPEPERAGSSADDERLSQELQAKVRELFGSRNNVTIDINADSDVQFVVQREDPALDAQQRKSAWAVIWSVGVISVAVGILFTALYYSGAVHGSFDSDKRYEMPTYGSHSYIDPYQLLEEGRQEQDSPGQ
ncbi:hypothetical protein FGB62_69g239 [Gracilaria domingensis]|nr:hypothetical protein FGB62_69g239 [Gracilaria domingensis]